MTDAEQLEAELDHLYRCILAADFDELAKILDETEHLLLRMLPLKDKCVAQRLQHKANRNGLCLQAAARGLRAAQRRLGEMATAGACLSTYSSVGRRVEVATSVGAMAKRL